MAKDDVKYLDDSHPAAQNAPTQPDVKYLPPTFTPSVGQGGPTLGIPPPQPDISQGQNFEQGMTHTVAPFVGRAATEGLPIAGSFVGGGPIGVGAGIVAGSLLKNLIRQIAPGVFGQPASSYPLDAAVDVVGQGLIPAAVGKGGEATYNLVKQGLPGLIYDAGGEFPAVKEGIARILSQEAERKYNLPETGIIESAGQNALNNYNDLLEKYGQTNQPPNTLATNISNQLTITPPTSTPATELTQGATPRAMSASLGNKISKAIATDKYKITTTPDPIDFYQVMDLANDIGENVNDVKAILSKRGYTFYQTAEGQAKHFNAWAKGIPAQPSNAAPTASAMPPPPQPGPIQQTASQQQALNDIRSGFGKNDLGNKLLTLQKEFEEGTDVARSQTYKSIANQALSDVTQVNNWKLATGEPKTIEQLALNKLLTNNWTETSKAFDGTKVLNELAGPNKEIYEAAIGPNKLNDLKDLAQNIANQQRKGTMDSIVKWSGGHLLWEVPAILGTMTGGLMGHVSGTVGSLGAAASTVTLTNSALRRLMANDSTAKLVVQAMKTPASSPQALLINRALQSATKGIAGLLGTQEAQ